MRPSVRLSVCLFVCLKPKFGQLFSLSCLNLRESAERTCNKKERTCNKKTKFGPTFYVLYTFNASVRSFVRLSVRPSVRLSVCLKPKFGQLFDLSCLNLRESAERTCNKKTKFGPTFYVLYSEVSFLLGRPTICIPNLTSNAHNMYSELSF